MVIQECINEKQKNKEFNFEEYWDVNGIYILLLIVSITLILLAYMPTISFIGNGYDRVTLFLEGDFFNSVCSNFGFGICASVAVAWILDIKQREKDRRKNAEITKFGVLPIANALVRYMQSYCLYYSIENIEYRSKKFNFLKWSDIYCDWVDKNDETLITPIRRQDMLEMLEDVLNRCQNLLDNESWYLQEGIMTFKELEEIKDIESECWRLKFFCTLESEYPDVHNIRIGNNELFNKLKETEVFKEFCEIEYSYDIRLERYIIRQ